MPSGRYVTTLTGVSTTSSSFPTWFPDTAIRPFSVSVSAAVNSTAVVYTVSHTLDYTGSSAFISTAATWYASSGITVATTNAFTAYTFPVTAIQLASTAGSATGTVTMTIVQAG